MNSKRVGFGLLCRVLALVVGLGLGSVFAQGTIPEPPVDGDNIIDQVGNAVATGSETGLPIFAGIVILIAAGAVIAGVAIVASNKAGWGQVAVTIAAIVVVVPIVLFLINLAAETFGGATGGGGAPT